MKTVRGRVGRQTVNEVVVGKNNKLTCRSLAVLVLAGGPSAEREVSLASGRQVIQALNQMGHRVIAGDIGPDDLSSLDTKGIDVVFPVLHGTFGEDGQLQRILERRHLRYVGSDSRTSQLAMNKYESKMIFEKIGLLTPPSELIKADDGQFHTGETAAKLKIQKILKQLGLPCVVKPNCQGSSIGVTIVRREDEAIQAVGEVLATWGDCLMEKFIAGREITVGIVADQVLPVLEIRAAEGFYDYQAKYKKEDTQYIFDMGVEEWVLQAVQQASRRAFESLGCRDLGRVDFILDDQGRGHILEVNTIPGLTDHSLVPKAALRAGMSMGEICDKIVQIAYDRPI